MEFETIPTVPTADEVLDRSLRRAAAKKKLKINVDRANEEFVRAVSSAIYDKLKSVVSSFPSFERLPPFYREVADILVSLDRLKKSLGAVTWAADQVRVIGSGYARSMRSATDTGQLRRQAVARIASVVHQVDDDLIFLNKARNILRKLPHVSEDEFTVVVAGYPNVGKSSFIRLVSTAEPEIAAYPFTTKGVIVGHRDLGKSERVQFIDTPGVLERPADERNPIERQAVSAIINTADVVLFILDASEHCGYALDDQVRLQEEIQGLVDVPVVTVANKADIRRIEDYPAISTLTGEGVEGVLDLLLRHRKDTRQASLQEPPRSETQQSRRRSGAGDPPGAYPY
ncbi:NOG1 family protein [Methanoculleus bourgensis]|uniref:NOG1 family protein n=1 Tax=Methanoculleus bourgensis TaxID=83986 RepID=UPI0022EF0E86|nr:GTPase [Methanoculleus bourgensis]GLI47445.1 GTP-binding protein [Methanoculleus bourgensis]